MPATRCVRCGRRCGARAEYLYSKPDESRVYLCGRRECADKYNGLPVEPCDCKAHGARRAA